MEIESLSRRFLSLSLSPPSLSLNRSLSPPITVSLSLPLSALARRYYGDHCGTLSSTTIVIPPSPPPPPSLPLSPPPPALASHSLPFHIAPGSTTTPSRRRTASASPPARPATPYLPRSPSTVVLSAARVSTATTYVSLPPPSPASRSRQQTPGAYLIYLTTCC